MSETTIFSQMALSYSFVKNYNRLALLFNSLKLTGFRFTDISGSTSLTLNEIIVGCSQMIAIIDGALTNFSKKIKELESEVEKYKPYHALLKTYLETPEFKVDTDLLEKLPRNVQRYLIEASNCFNHGEYIACCSMCGNVLEGLINDECKQRDIKEVKLISKASKLLDALSQEGKKVEEPHRKLIEVVKFYRDHADHPTDEIFSRERASLFINTLLILCKEVFTA